MEDTMKDSQKLITCESANEMDNEASYSWGLNSFSLTEAAGKSCADMFIQFFKIKKNNPVSLAVFAGSGNNGADALIMLKTLCFKRYAKPALCNVFIIHSPKKKNCPISEILCLIEKIKIPIVIWDEQIPNIEIEKFDYIIDGITGSGLKTELQGNAALMVKAIQKLNGPKIISIDLPSGNFEGWKPGMPIISSHATLAIEPQKLCLYKPAGRKFAGNILPVTGIFPPDLYRKYCRAELVNWKITKSFIPMIPATAHKHERGLVEIWAGSKGFTGAAKLASLGAQAAGAGLIRLIIDPELYSCFASSCFGIMAVPADMQQEDSRFVPNAILLGPGWGKSEDRKKTFNLCLEKEKQGIPLILDADAIILAKGITFNGNAIITPHPGEFAALSGHSKEDILSDPIPVLRRFSSEKNMVVLFKSHVLYICSPDGRIGIIDGMNAALSTGGTGDVLAGFCAAIAARLKPFNAYNCACTSASLLQETVKKNKLYRSFAGPEDFANAASSIAGAAWLKKRIK